MLFEKIHLEDDEKIIIIVRKHWFFLFSKSTAVILAAFAPIVAWFVITNYLGSSAITSALDLTAYTKHFFFLQTVWLLLSWISLAHIWTDYYLDLWAVTDRRIIAIDQVSLFRRQTGSFRLEKLQDMNIEINGIIPTMLHYGSIEAQTASGSEEEFQARYIPKPRELKSVILRAADERMKVQNGNGQQNT